MTGLVVVRNVGRFKAVKKLEVAQRVVSSSVSIAFSRVMHRFKEGSDLPLARPILEPIISRRQ
jgi:hypothetical protein